MKKVYVCSSFGFTGSPKRNSVSSLKLGGKENGLDMELEQNRGGMKEMNSPKFESQKSLDEILLSKKRCRGY